MKLKLTSNSLDLNKEETDVTKNLSQNKIQFTIRYVENITKTVVIYIIMYLSLFKEHDGDILDPELVKKILNFLSHIWRRIGDSDPELLKKYEWARISSDLIKLKDWSDDGKELRNWRVDKRAQTGISWKIVSYWIESNNKKIRTAFRNSKNDLNLSVIEIINKIIFYANYQTLSQNVKRKKRKQ